MYFHKSSDNIYQLLYPISPKPPWQDHMKTLFLCLYGMRAKCLIHPNMGHRVMFTTHLQKALLLCDVTVWMK